MLTGGEVMASYASAIGKKKAETPAYKLFLLGIIAGIMIGLGGVAAATASHGVENLGVARLIAGALFPFGLAMVMLMGTELFTGNTMIVISVLDRSASWKGLLKNWVCVYFGNMVGAILLAAGIVWSGQLDLGGGKLVLYVVKTAVSKCGIAFGPAIILGILCNILVCLGVLCSLTAKDTTGRILGAYAPVILFIVGGFEHCVANMYYIPAGIFALMNPKYNAMVMEAGIHTAVLGWKNMFFTNLLPVTLGNIIGGAGIAIILWFCHRMPLRGELNEETKGR